MSPGEYTFAESLPLAGIERGTTLFVTGSSLSRARGLVLSMVLGETGIEDGALFISTTNSANRVLDRCERLAEFDESRVGVVDCSGQDQGVPGRTSRVEAVSSPSDLTGIGIKFSAVYEALYRACNQRVRVGMVSVSTLLMYTQMRTVFRFLHTLSGRISSTNGIGIFFIDPESHESQTVNTLGQVCDGRIEVRDTDDPGADGELRVRGLPGQPEEWTAFTLPQRE